MESLDDILIRNEGLPPAKKMFGEFWYEGELCILFGKTNTGKSHLAFQIAMGLVNPSESEHFQYDGEKIKVLYFDLELSERQIATRLKGVQKTEGRFLRVAFDSDYFHGAETQDDAFEEIGKMILEYKPGALILDNISVFHPDNEKASDATKLLNQLNNIKRKHKLPILAIGHTPKISSGLPIEITQLQGSAQMGNLIDSAFAIGKTSDKDKRYLKQVKVRETEYRYDSENVLLIEFTKQDEWVHFNAIEQAEEYELLSFTSNTSASLDERDKEIFRLHTEGTDREDIMRIHSISKSRFYEIIKKMK